MRQSRWNSWMDHPDQEVGKASDAKLFTFCIWYFIFWKKTSVNLTGSQRRLTMQNFSNFAKRQKPPKASGIWGAGQRAKGLLEENWAKFLKPPARLHYVLRRRTSKESFKFDNRAILRQPKTLLIWGGNLLRMVPSVLVWHQQKHFCWEYVYFWGFLTFRRPAPTWSMRRGSHRQSSFPLNIKC